jgi:hypothetical protein
MCYPGGGCLKLEHSHPGGLKSCGEEYEVEVDEEDENDMGSVVDGGAHVGVTVHYLLRVVACLLVIWEARIIKTLRSLHP